MYMILGLCLLFCVIVSVVILLAAVAISASRS